MLEKDQDTVDKQSQDADQAPEGPSQEIEEARLETQTRAAEQAEQGSRTPALKHALENALHNLQEDGISKPVAIMGVLRSAATSVENYYKILQALLELESVEPKDLVEALSTYGNVPDTSVIRDLRQINVPTEELIEALRSIWGKKRLEEAFWQAMQNLGAWLEEKGL